MLQRKFPQDPKVTAFFFCLEDGENYGDIILKFRIVL
jgi:hypothetical protein